MGAVVYTIVLEALRSILQFAGISQEWRQVFAPLMLIFLMIYRPKGIMGMREFPFLIPEAERFQKISLNPFSKKNRNRKKSEEVKS